MGVPWHVYCPQGLWLFMIYSFEDSQTGKRTSVLGEPYLKTSQPLAPCQLIIKTKAGQTIPQTIENLAPGDDNIYAPEYLCSKS